jgi:mRNA interferase MazF
MVAFVRGDVVVVPFPFSDLSSSKKRPALIIATLTGVNVIICPISSQNRTGNKYAIELKTSDMQNGTLKQTSYVQTDIVFTANSTIINYKVGEISSQKLEEITSTLVKIIEGKI